MAEVAGVHHQRQPACFHDLVDGHQARIVHVHFLRVGMQLHAVKPQLDHAVDFRLGVLEILVHGAESDELGMQLALLGDEVVDGGDRMSRGGDRMHDEVRDGRALALGEQRLGGAVLVLHRNVVELADSRHRAGGDLVGVDMRVRVDDCHGGSSGMRKGAA